jgi:hypothetical protein
VGDTGADGEMLTWAIGSEDCEEASSRARESGLTGGDSSRELDLAGGVGGESVDAVSPMVKDSSLFSSRGFTTAK